ncbi:uncharacterized protein LOC127078784 [Lathyrus oleraceus]|uniref:uncharacterized protein LOC127078784 n=1 Tax=Pisum sativum TaxID=3888 RepID=UPI0021CEC638|nr:uncharacterized protein LOC127078784 [Pisum sativum]
MAMIVVSSVVIQNMVIPKLKDPGSFSIPCQTGTMKFERALCDLGTSVSLVPLSLCKKLDMGEMKLTIVSLQLEDISVKYLVGVLEDVPIKVGEYYVPVEFVTMEIENESQFLILLGRAFLAMMGAIIDVKRGKFNFEVG